MYAREALDEDYFRVMRTHKADVSLAANNGESLALMIRAWKLTSQVDRSHILNSENSFAMWTGQKVGVIAQDYKRLQRIFKHSKWLDFAARWVENLWGRDTFTANMITELISTGITNVSLSTAHMKI